MPRIKLTKSAIDALPTPSSDVVYWDAAYPGFGVKITPKGRKVFIVLYRTGGAGSYLRKYTIGPYGRVTLHQARVAAQKVFAAKLVGLDPAAEKREAKRRVVADRVDDLLEDFWVDVAVSSLRSEEARTLRTVSLVGWVIASCLRARAIMRRRRVWSSILKELRRVPEYNRARESDRQRQDRSLVLRPGSYRREEQIRAGEKRGTRGSAPRDQRAASTYICGAICANRARAQR